MDGLIAGITDALLSCVSAFGAVTLTFAVMERKKVQLEMKKAEKWSVEKLSGDGKTSGVPMDAEISGACTG